MRSLLKHKKGQAMNLQGIILSLVIVGILLGIAFVILSGFYDKLTAGTEAALAVNETIVALKTVPTWLGIIVIVLVAGIILGVVMSVLPKASNSV